MASVAPKTMMNSAEENLVTACTGTMPHAGIMLNHSRLLTV